MTMILAVLALNDLCFKGSRSPMFGQVLSQFGFLGFLGIKIRVVCSS